MKNSLPERNRNLDLLRIFACVLVILVHTSSGLAYMSVSDSGWRIIHICNTLAHSGNILFLMISGSLLLSEDYSFRPRKFYTHNFLRLAVSYMLWLILFNGIGVIRYGLLAQGSITAAVVQDAVKNVIRGIASYQFWFIPMLLGLYLLLPMLRAICHASRGLSLYFTALFLTVCLLFNTILAFDFPHKYLFESLMTRIPFTLVNHYAGYFVMGYVFGHILKRDWFFPKLAAHGKPAGALLTAAGVLLSLAGDSFLAVQNGSGNSIAMNELFSLCPCMVACGLFLLTGSLKLPGSGRPVILLERLSGLTFGVYMLHPLLMPPVQQLTEGLSLAPAPEILMNTLLLLLLCLALAYVLSLIPPLRKWLLFMGSKK